VYPRPGIVASRHKENQTVKSSFSLRWLILVSIGAAVVVSLVPAAVILDRRLARELETSARSDLALAPRLLQDRNDARKDMLMMHAREFADMDGLGSALAESPAAGQGRLLAMAPPHPGEEPLLVGPDGSVLMGVAPDASLLSRTREGESPAGFVMDAGGIYMASLAPVMEGDEWMGAVGYSMPADENMAATLAGLTGSEVVVVSSEGQVLGATFDPDDAARLADLALGDGGPGDSGEVREVRDSGLGRSWVTVAPLGEVGRIVFVRFASTELAVIPALRRGALLAGALGLLMALLAGGLLASTVARPVRALADAADSLSGGQFDTPLPESSIGEVERMASAFEGMREALAARLADLEAANVELQERQDRLTMLQTEMVQRDRLAATGRLLGELAHEIRNPVANVRNCLEVVRRGAEDRPELRQFADLAIDELLRMHELAEQMLDLNRPLDPGATRCDPTEVARTVAALAGAGGGPVPVSVVAPETVPGAAIPPEALRQVLLNLVQNARESQEGAESGGQVEIRVASDGALVTMDVVDAGPGIPEDVLPRIFDPFFTTKDEASGTGLGLYLAEGIVRRHGGSLNATNREGGAGAVFRIRIPVSALPESRAEDGGSSREDLP
jgi:signal transduction histidine kinase